MRIRVLGAGVYGCHIGLRLLQAGHEVEIHEIQSDIFCGASGHIPARLHQGFHYPRSRKTREACQGHIAAFMEIYGDFTRAVPVNVYAIAAETSLIDYDQYVQTLRGELQFVTIDRPIEFGLVNVEGAVLTGERHIVTDRLREYFREMLEGHLIFNSPPGDMDDERFDWTIDCTFGASSAANVDRYEPCLVLLLKGPADRAITIMDGPFPSLYPWNEAEGLSSLSSALWTPFSKTCRTWAEANKLLQDLHPSDIHDQGARMLESMAHFYPAIEEYKVEREMISIRAMPKSGADTRLVDIAQDGNVLRVRAGKIDAVIHAGNEIIDAVRYLGRVPRKAVA